MFDHSNVAEIYNTATVENTILNKLPVVGILLQHQCKVSSNINIKNKNRTLIFQSNWGNNNVTPLLITNNSRTYFGTNSRNSLQSNALQNTTTLYEFARSTMECLTLRNHKNNIPNQPFDMQKVHDEYHSHKIHKKPSFDSDIMIHLRNKLQFVQKQAIIIHKHHLKNNSNMVYIYFSLQNIFRRYIIYKDNLYKSRPHVQSTDKCTYYCAKKDINNIQCNGKLSIHINNIGNILITSLIPCANHEPDYNSKLLLKQQLYQII